jgi:glycosyltransferase involved in cell wall biosynthesis
MSKIVQAARWRNLKSEDILMHSELSNEEESYYELKYKISQYDELPFCVVVPTFNNAQNNRHISNIQSIVMQNYRNYRIVVIDDASTDSTAKEVREYLQMQTKVKPDSYSVIENRQNQGSSSNMRHAALDNCMPDSVFLMVDGDDELVGRQVLKLYNAVYQESGAWIVYSNFFTEDGKLGYSKPFPDRVTEANAYRKYPFVTSHLRSLYTQLLRNIREEDLQGKDGEYLRAANDVSVMLPCLEMAHRRVIYIPELTYLYNIKTGLNNHQLKLLEQKRNERYIRQKKAYPLLEQLFQKNSTEKTFSNEDGLHESA